jgi:hypothetical protein
LPAGSPVAEGAFVSLPLLDCPHAHINAARRTKDSASDNNLLVVLFIKISSFT